MLRMHWTPAFAGVTTFYEFAKEDNIGKKQTHNCTG